MGQLYVPEGTWTLCSNGKRIVKLKVNSQRTIKIEGGKLAATENDRFDDNFVCPPMMAAGAMVGVVLATALVASGPGLVIFAAGAVGAAAGGTVLVNNLPSICSLLCNGSEWTVLHSKVKFEGKRALLQNATLNCMLGGTITFKMPNYQESIDAGLLAGNVVYGDLNGLTAEELAIINSYERVAPNTIDIESEFFGKGEDTGFDAKLYKSGDKYVLVFRGTAGGADWLEDGKQAMGISSDYYDQAVKLITEMKKQKIKGEYIFTSDNTIIAGHSLGGGLAAIAGGTSGFPSYTYNAAGVHDATLARQKKQEVSIKREDMDHVQAYNTSGDILNVLQDSREGLLNRLGLFGKIMDKTEGVPRAAGQRMELETGIVGSGETLGHAGINVVRALKEEAEKAASQSVIAKRT